MSSHINSKKNRSSDNLNTDREEMMKKLLDQFGHVIKELHVRHGIPFGDLKLNKPQVMILFYLSKNNNGATVKEIADFMKITPGAITQFADGLVEKELIRREEDKNDRRKINMYLTDLAHKGFKTLEDSYLKSVCSIFDDLDIVEINELYRLLSKLKIEKKSCF